MPSSPQDTPAADRGLQDRRQLIAAIGKQVTHALGQPNDLQQVQVRLLWGDRYRVNVLVGGDAVSARVAHSYFLVADGNGNILASTPQITRRY
jgi:hypothetical protein